MRSIKKFLVFRSFCVIFPFPLTITHASASSYSRQFLFPFSSSVSPPSLLRSCGRSLVKFKFLRKRKPAPHVKIFKLNITTGPPATEVIAVHHRSKPLLVAAIHAATYCHRTPATAGKFSSLSLTPLVQCRMPSPESEFWVRF